VKDVASNGPRPLGPGGGAVMRTGESTRGAGDAALHDGHAGPGGVEAWWQRPGYARDRRVGQRGDGALTGGPRPHSGRARFKHGFKVIQKYSNGSNEIRIPPNFGWFRRYLPVLKIFEIK
jgi:hypothetical protein